MRIYYPLFITESGWWVVPYATKERSWIVRFKCNILTIKRYQKRTTVGNIPLGVPVNKPAHTTNCDGKLIAPKPERAEPRSLQGEYGRTTVGNTLRVFRVNKLTHTITYNGNRIAPIAERARATFLTGWWFLKASISLRSNKLRMKQRWKLTSKWKRHSSP